MNNKNILILDCDLISGKNNTANAIEQIIKDNNIKIKKFRVCENIFPKNISEFTHVIITGSDADIYDDKKWIETLESLIKKINQTRIKMLGICFGHQIIGKVLGAKILKGKQEKGFIKISKTSSNNLFKNIDKLCFFEYHSWYITAIPKGSKILAKNELCIQAIQFDKNTYGVQFHPEVNLSLAKIFLESKSKKDYLSKKENELYDIERKSIFRNFLEI